MADNSTITNLFECPKCKIPIATLYMPCPSCGYYECTPP